MRDPESPPEVSARLQREHRQLRRQYETMERQQRLRIGAMRGVQAELESTVEQLREALEESRRASRIKDTFLANLSHELRTPLHGINSAAELLSGRQLDPESTDLIRLILTSGSKLRTQLERLIDYAIAESGQLVLDPRPIELALLIEGTVEPERLEAESKGIAFSVDLEPDRSEWIRIDAARLAQALSSIVDNAVKYTRAGGVKIRVRKLQEGRTLEIVVEDSGIGIPEHELERVFHPFAQVDESRSRQVNGTGIGLAHARRIITAMGGSVELRSERSRGTTVEILLPLEVALESDDASVPGDLVGTRTLVVDDNSVNRLVAKKMLEQLGCRVECAASGEEALELLEAGEEPDFVLMDCSMPDMDGYETTRAIQALPGSVRLTPIVALTAHALPEDRHRAFESGMCGFLTKPLSAGELQAALLRLIGS